MAQVTAEVIDKVQEKFTALLSHYVTVENCQFEHFFSFRSI